MRRLIHRHTVSFKNAFAGLFWALSTQPNYRIHFILSLFSIFAGFYFSISYFEWLIIFVLITIGLVIETLNTALESTNDAITREMRPEIKIAKDVAAAAMLIFAFGSSVIAFLIFFPKL
jgi:diacylglycerol kinase (ATP)